MNLQEMFASLYKEITDHSKGDTIDELNSTKRILQSIINDAKARRAAKTKKLLGKWLHVRLVIHQKNIPVSSIKSRSCTADDTESERVNPHATTSN
jgi:hypothetical protein